MFPWQRRGYFKMTVDVTPAQPNENQQKKFHPQEFGGFEEFLLLLSLFFYYYI